MRILIVRHADPNYEIDGLTEKGTREVALLTKRLCKEKIDHFYCSPLGRARATIAPTLRALGTEAVICDWLKEFNYSHIQLPYEQNPSGGWDILPEYMNESEILYSPTEWREAPIIKGTQKLADYDWVCHEFDALLEAHGYRREGRIYRAERPNHDTILLACHFGLGAVLLSHLMFCSPYSLWQHTCLAPTSVTTAYTEERRKGIASIRLSAIGDTSHLFEIEPISFSGRFCECFTDDTRHD
ncbi:MAG: histidine phosphatase family protein [Clostridia bacterium]|nr:histidine phosphatase family protein [Clostridia bacterium]